MILRCSRSLVDGSGAGSGAQRLLLLLAAVGSWLAATPYIGIDHDATLYVVAAMRWLSPEAYIHDPLFIDAQDRWSLFSPLLAGALKVFGVEYGAMLMTLLGGALFSAAAFALTRCMLRGPVQLLAFLLCVSLPLAYAFGDVLLVSEGFVTARSFAVPVAMLALAAGLCQRWATSAVLHGVALALHPIMGLAPAGLSLLLRFRRQARYLLGAAALVVAAIFAAAQAGWLARVDAFWLANLQSDGVVFIGRWVVQESDFLLGVFGALALAGRFGHPRLRPFYVWALVVTLCGVALSLLASSFVFPAILLQVQPWRAVWLGLLLAVIALADVGSRQLLRRHAPWRLCFLLLAAAVLALGEHAGSGLAGLALLLWGVNDRHLAAAERRLRPYRRYVLVLLVGVLVLQFPGYLASLSLRAGEFAGNGTIAALADGFFRSGGFGLAAVLLWFLLRWPKRLPAMLALLCYAAYAGLHWDQRAVDRAAWEARYAVDGRFAAFRQWIGRGDVVYWHRSAERVWFELATAGYAGRRHVAGIVFSRERFALLEPRMERILAATLSEAQLAAAEKSGGVLHYAAAQSPRFSGQVPAQMFFQARVLSSYERMQPPTGFGLRQLCADADLDYVVDSSRLEGVFLAEAEELSGGRRIRWYLYRCRDLRQVASHSGAPGREPIHG